MGSIKSDGQEGSPKKGPSFESFLCELHKFLFCNEIGYNFKLYFCEPFSFIIGMRKQSDHPADAEKANALTRMLLEHPELMEPLEEMLQMLRDEQALPRTAEDAELKVLQITRSTGNRLLHAWAQRKHDNAINEVLNPGPGQGQGAQQHAKKNSAG